jgi:hypothetical protein
MTPSARQLEGKAWLERAFPGRTFWPCSCGAVIDTGQFAHHDAAYPNHQHDRDVEEAP